MAIIATEKTVVLVQGITGKEGAFRAERMIGYGTKIAAGVTPGKGGQKVVGVPVYDSVEEAKAAHPEINTCVQMVPAPLVKDATMEALDADIGAIVAIAEGVPFQDTMEMVAYAKKKNAVIVGPNTPGVISPGICELGATAQSCFHGPGKIGVMSCTGSIQWYLSRLISLRGWGESTFVGLGGDLVKGVTVDECLKMFEEDPQTEATLVISEIGGDAEMKAAEMVKSGELKKPFVVYMYGRSAPPGKRMGHAGAIIEAGKGDIKSKVEALKSAGVTTVTYPWEVIGVFDNLGIKPIPELWTKPIREAKVGR